MLLKVVWWKLGFGRKEGRGYFGGGDGKRRLMEVGVGHRLWSVVGCLSVEQALGRLLRGPGWSEGGEKIALLFVVCVPQCSIL